MRGMFTAGLIDVFLENGISFDGAAGISAGAVFGCNYKSRQIGRAIRYNRKYCKDPRYCSLRSLITTGDLYGSEFCYHTIPDELDVFDRETFKADPMEFIVGVTDVDTGKPAYHKCCDGGEKDIEWMRASASMPLVSKPVAIDGRRYLDGGMSDSVPFEYMESLGYNRNVIVLTRPYGYRKSKGSFDFAYKLLLAKYPAMVRAMQERYLMYNAQMEEAEKRERDGLSLIIRPPADIPVSRTERDPDKLEKAYDIGRNTAVKQLSRVREFLGQSV